MGKFFKYFPRYYLSTSASCSQTCPEVVSRLKVKEALNEEH